MCLYDDSDILTSKFKDNGDSWKKNVVHAEARPVMESLYLILNLGNTVAMERAVQLPRTWR